MNIEIKCGVPELWPERAYITDAGADLRVTDDWFLAPGEKKLFDTGVAIKIPEGYVGLVFNRSSQGKIRVVLTNGVGVIDSSYRGNIKVLLANDGETPYQIKAYDTRVAQLVIVPIALPQFTHYEGEWDDTARSTGGFGSTGV